MLLRVYNINIFLLRFNLKIKVYSNIIIMQNNSEMENINVEDLHFTHQDNKQTIKLKNIVGSTRDVKTESIYKYLFLNASASDSSKVDVNKYGELGFQIQPISPIFCDNIMLAVAVPIEKTKRQHEDGGNLQLAGGTLNSMRQKILEFFILNSISGIKHNDVSPKRIVKMDGIKNHLKPLDSNKLEALYKLYRLEYNKDTAEAYAQYFKVELSDLNYNQIITIFNTNNLYDLEANFIYIADIDFTRDYTAGFNKDLLINHLLSEGFRLESSEDYAEKTILNNNNSVGKNCLSFMFKDARYKIYNKFWHSIEVKSNVQQIGTNIYNWVNNTEKRLKENIPKSLEHGFTRLEITFYRNNNTIPTEEEINTALDNLHNYLPDNIIYNTPINKQWLAYTECINNNVLIIDLHNRTAALCYSINGLTKRVCGIMLKNPDNKKNKNGAIDVVDIVNNVDSIDNEDSVVGIDNSDNVKQAASKKDILDSVDILYLLTYCTMDVPILILFIDFEEKQETNIKIKKDKRGSIVETEEITAEKYINISYRIITTHPKEGIKRTNMFKPNNLYYSLTNAASQAGTSNKPQSMGLEDTSLIKLVIQATNSKALYKAKKFKFPFYAIWHTTPTIDFKCPKQIEELNIINNYNAEHNIQIQTLREDNAVIYNNFVEKQKDADNFKNDCLRILDLLKRPIKDLNTLVKYYMCKIKVIKPAQRQFGKSLKDTYILITTKEDVLYATPNITMYLDKVFKTLKLDVLNYGFFNLDNFGSILEFKIEDIYISEGKRYAKTGRLQLNPNMEERIKSAEQKINNLENLTLDNYALNATVREKDCTKLEELEEGTELLIIAIKLKDIGKKQKYVFTVDGRPNIFLSNSHMEDLFKIKALPEHKFKIKVGPIKMDKNKKKFRCVFL